MALFASSLLETDPVPRCALRKQTGSRKVTQNMKNLGRQGYVSPICIGLIYDALGERSQEFAWYEKGYDDRAEWLPWFAIDPIFDDVRADPRF